MSDSQAAIPEPDSALSLLFVELLGALPDGVLVATSDGRIVAMNRNLCELSGYAVDELIAQPIETLVPNRVRAEHVAARSLYVAHGGGIRPMSERSDIELQRADGTTVPVDIALSTIPHGDEVLVLATVRDASVRRAAELIVERERAVLTAMNDVSYALLVDGEVDETLRLVTERARRLFEADLAVLVMPDLARGDLVVRTVDGLGARELFGSAIPLDSSVARLVMREREPVLLADGSQDPRLFRPPGWPDDIGPTLVVPLHAQGETLGSITIARRRGSAMFLASDVTFMKTFAEKATLALALSRTRDLIRREHDLLVAATASEEELDLQRELVGKLEDLSRAKSDFVARISHELRTPLTSVIGYVELLRDAPPEGAEQRAHMLSIVDRNSRRLSLLIEDLLTVSLVDSGEFALHFAALDLDDVVEQVCQSVAPAVAKKKLALRAAPGHHVVIGDRDQLERAVGNLVSNAVKFTPPGGRIDITLRSCGDAVMVAVGDDGPGIPAEEQGDLFSRFFRATRSRELEVPGTGLGLYIVKQIAELHGGTVQVHSSEAGSSFEILLPTSGPTGPNQPVTRMLAEIG